MNHPTNSSLPASRILIVEDDADLREALLDSLQLEGFDVLEAESAERALSLLECDAGFDLIISDVNMGKLSGHDLLKQVRQNFPHIPVLLITAYASISESVDAMRNGAVDYLVKPFEVKLLLETVNKFIGLHARDADEPIAVAEPSQQLLQLACRVAQSDTTVLLLGESGTGKEVLAKYIHNQSARRDKPFVAINCAAIPENMLEAMLFGHEKGAYTGAYQSAPGKFEQANGGTLLLDEISEMDMGLQAKLLRVLQEREVERLGGRKNIPLDVRVIATSNRDMRQQVAAGKFREDLYFRLSVLPLQWAPLRERRADIIPLAERLLHRHAAKQNRLGVQLTPAARRELEYYPWPGNVRELDNVMQRALILQSGLSIGPDDLGLVAEYGAADQASFASSVAQETKASLMGLASDVESGCEQALPGEASARLEKDLMQREYEIILQTLKQERGSKKNTAERLGISPRTLRYKLAKFREEGLNVEALAF